MILIPAGEFMMGSPEDEPKRGKDETQHRVMITKDSINALASHPLVQKQERMP